LGYIEQKMSSRELREVISQKYDHYDDYWLVVEPTRLKNMIVKNYDDHFKLA